MPPQRSRPRLLAALLQAHIKTLNRIVQRPIASVPSFFLVYIKTWFTSKSRISIKATNMVESGEEVTMNLTEWSWLFLALYIALMVGIGLYAQRKIKHADDFATARGAYGPFFLALAFAPQPPVARPS